MCKLRFQDLTPDYDIWVKPNNPQLKFLKEDVSDSSDESNSSDEKSSD